MKKIIAVSLATLMIGSSAALAGQPLNPSMYGPKVTAADREIARISAPGDLFTTTTSDGPGWHANTTYQVRPDGSLKPLMIGYHNAG
ncbi:hypothetical protein [Martelella limonii]|uniref:hypothetical protein n=1 Tax=Martelella limonii TaxID=1647649 RepID=UPI00157FC0ED|nr:hypothetical protein [Martelella limonii]